MIKAWTLYGTEVHIPKEQFQLRVSAYGIVFFQGKLLTMFLHKPQKLYLPGGGIDQGEPAEEGVKREILEETGIAVHVEKFITFRETFFYSETFDQAYQNYSLFFHCIPLIDTHEGFSPERPEEHIEYPLWKDIAELSAEDFHMPVNAVFEDIRRLAS